MVDGVYPSLLEGWEGGEGRDVGQLHGVPQSVQHAVPALDQRVGRDSLQDL